MVKRYLRTSKIVVKKRRLPSGRVGVIFRKRKTSKPRCPKTGEVLNGTLYGRKKEMNKYSKTEKRPTRYYGGVLSANALKMEIINKVAKEYNE